MGPALGLAARGKEFGFCRQLHAKPLLKLKGDVVSFLCYRFSGCGGGAGRTSPRLPPSCMGQAAPSPLALRGSRVHTGWPRCPAPQSCPPSLEPCPCMLYGAPTSATPLAASGPPREPFLQRPGLWTQQTWDQVLSWLQAGRATLIFFFRKVRVPIPPTLWGTCEK